jgi:SAM-dependent methyltransferase
MNLRDTYNQIAEDWYEDHRTDDWWVEGTNKFISMLKNNDLVLDVGCGGGVKSNYLSKRGLRVVGIDFSEKMIEIAKREYSSPEFILLNLDDVNKLDYLFDGVFMQAVLLHVPKVEVSEKIKNVVEKLKTNGLLYIAVKEKRTGGKEEEVMVENDYGYSYERFFSYFSIDEIKSYVIDAKLEILSSSKNLYGNTSWIQIIAKK